MGALHTQHRQISHVYLLEDAKRAKDYYCQEEYDANQRNIQILILSLHYYQLFKYVNWQEHEGSRYDRKANELQRIRSAWHVCLQDFFAYEVKDEWRKYGVQSLPVVALLKHVLIGSFCKVRGLYMTASQYQDYA